MGADRFVVAALARPRKPWFAEVAAWANGASIPVEYVKCIGVHELRARLDSGRAFSAALLDASAPGVERDLLEELRSCGTAVIVVSDPTAARRNWRELGADVTLPMDFDRGAFMETLRAHANPIASTTTLTAAAVEALLEGDDVSGFGVEPWRGHVVTVVGGHGAGTSTLAMSLAQGLAASAANRDSVVLADLANRADLAMYHGVGDVVPGLQELVESHRGPQPSLSTTASLLFEIEERGYRLLLGLRRRRDWTALSERALGAGLGSLRRGSRWLICDADDELDAESETGSADMEDRTAAARVAIDLADVVVVVGTATVKGALDHVRTMRAVLDHGVDPERVLTVVNRAPRSSRARAEVVEALHALGGGVGAATPLMVPDARGIDDVHRRAGRLPGSLCGPIARAVEAMIDHNVDWAGDFLSEPVAVRPGSLGLAYAHDSGHT